MLLLPAQGGITDSSEVSSPVCVRTVLGDDHLQFAQPAHGCSVSAGGELQKEALLLLTKRVQRLPKLPKMDVRRSVRRSRFKTHSKDARKISFCH